MDDVLRGGRRLLALGALALAGGCHPYDGPPIGVSGPRHVVDVPPPVDAGAPAAPSPVPADFRERFARVADRAPSHGHADRFDAVVWTNDVGRAAWDASGDFADGAMLVEEAIEKTAKGDRAAGLLVMEKHAGTWRFVVVEPGGGVAKDSQEKACAECHAQAPRDFVFRLPRDAPRPAASP